jgi:hypothetical protein
MEVKLKNSYNIRGVKCIFPKKNTVAAVVRWAEAEGVMSFDGRRCCFTVAEALDGGGWEREEGKVLGERERGEKAGWWAAALLHGGRRHWMVVVGAIWWWTVVGGRGEREKFWGERERWREKMKIGVLGETARDFGIFFFFVYYLSPAVGRDNIRKKDPAYAFLGFLPKTKAPLVKKKISFREIK